MTASSLQEIYQKPPSTATRIGIPLMVLFLLLCAVAATFIHFEDTVQGPVVLTTRVQPIRLLPTRTGVLKDVRVREGDVIREGELVAIYENDAEYVEVMDLKRSIEPLLQYDRTDFLQLPTPERRSGLGGLSVVYENFLDQHDRFLRGDATADATTRSTYQDVDNLAKSTLLTVNSLRAERAEILHRIQIEGKTLRVEKENFLAGNISQSRYNEQLDAFNELKSRVKLIEAKISAAQQLYNERKTGQSSTSGRLRSRNEELYNDLRTTLLNLVDALEGWQQRNLLRATATGTVAFADGLDPTGTTVNPARPLLSILPAELDTRRGVLGQLRLEAAERVRIHPGQPVRLRLDGFDSYTDGYLLGKVGDIPLVQADEKNFIITIDLPHGMQTHRGTNLTYAEGMSGTAEVICGEQNLLGVVFGIP